MLIRSLLDRCFNVVYTCWLNPQFEIVNPEFHDGFIRFQCAISLTCLNMLLNPN